MSNSVEKCEKKARIGFALCGSFCTFSEIIPIIRELSMNGFDVAPIMSEFAYATDTRFGKAMDFVEKLEAICGRKVIHDIADAEPIGPNRLFDLMVIAPCTGNTLAKLNHGITDTCVTMSAKSHLRNQNPLLLAVSTNDALGNSAKNIGGLMNYRNIFFVPMRQDNPSEKPRSVVADFAMIPKAVELALKNIQIQPVYI